MNKPEKIETDVAGRSAADLKFPQNLPHTHLGNFRSQSGTAIMRLASALCFPKFVYRMPL
jgi:hypothetical protein